MGQGPEKFLGAAVVSSAWVGDMADAGNTPLPASFTMLHFVSL